MCSVARVQTHRHTDTQTDMNVNTEDTLSGFQDFFFIRPIIKDRPNTDYWTSPMHFLGYPLFLEVMETPSMTSLWNDRSHIMTSAHIDLNSQCFVFLCVCGRLTRGGILTTSCHIFYFLLVTSLHVVLSARRLGLTPGRYINVWSGKCFNILV